MNPDLSAADRAFIAQAEAFVEQHWTQLAPSTPARLAGARAQRAAQSYCAALAERGWLVAHWPVAAGGAGWSVRECWLWEQVVAAAQAPQPPAVGPFLVGPLLLQHGTDTQRERHLPGIRSGTVPWCLALAEDSGALSGSIDRFTVATRARRQDEQWLLDGVKPWVLLDRPADNISDNSGVACVLATTSADSFGLFLVDLALPGVQVSPRPMVGEQSGRHAVSQLEFSQVTLPPAALLGLADQGLSLAAALEHAQLAVAGATARNQVLLEQLREVIEAGDFDGGELWADEGARTRLHSLEVELAGLQALEVRALAPDAPFAVAARLALAVRGAELSQQLADLQVEALGYFALPFVNPDSLDNEGPIGPVFAQAALLGMLSDRARAAIGAPREHLKNIIAKSVLELPDTGGSRG